jgi:hypothetical protein
MSKDNKVVRVNGWGFEGSWSAPRRGGVPLLGIFLIVLGLFLAASSIWNEVQIGASAFFLAIGILLIVVGLRDKSDLALYCGAFIGALSLADLLTGSHVVSGNGWGSLFVGLALVAIALFRSQTGRKLGWTMGFGVLLVIWGGWQAANTGLNLGLDRLVVPALIVLLGLYVINQRSRG